MNANLTQVLENIRLEYNVGYESFYNEAIKRAIEIIKERELDEFWTEEIVQQRMRDNEFSNTV